MKTTSTWNFRSIIGKMLMGLALAAMIGTIDVAPALGRDDYKRIRKHDNRRYQPSGRGYSYGKPYGYHYGYRERAYYPPPRVVYAPPPPPGISIFVPPFIIHP
jgi:hypothetical protein